MTDQYFPVSVGVQDEQITLMDDSTVLFRPAFARGLVQANSLGGPRLKLKRTIFVGGLDDRSALFGFLARVRGKQNPFWTSIFYTARGSFPGAELLNNGQFLNGTTGWTAASAAALQAVTRGMRLVANIPYNGNVLEATQNISALTLGLPYAFRVGFGAASAAIDALNNGPAIAGSALSSSSASQNNVNITSLVADTTGLTAEIVAGSGGPFLSGDFIDALYASFQQCAQVDTIDNQLLATDTLGSPWVGNNLTVTTAQPGADGSSTACALVENAVNSGHNIVQSFTAPAAVGDMSFGVALKANLRTWAVLQLYDGTNSCNVWFNLTTGAVGSNSVTVWANMRAGVTPLGNNWFYCWIIARKTTSATTISTYISAATANGSGTSYAGSNGSVAFYAWRPTALPLSTTGLVIGRPATLPTAGVLLGPSASQSGSQIYAKGLPVSTNGLLLVGDPVEINGELKICTADLNSDASGLGILSFEPELVYPPPDNAPIIVGSPLQKFVLSDDPVIVNQYGKYANVSFEMEQVY